MDRRVLRKVWLEYEYSYNSGNISCDTASLDDTINSSVTDSLEKEAP